MATRPTLHIAVANTKSKASDYNENFTLMMNYCEDVALEDKTYVDTNVNNRANRTLSNITSLSTEIKSLLSNDYATKDLSNVTGVSITSKMTNADKEAITNYVMPDLTRGISVPNLPYTAPSTGWYYTGAIGAVKTNRDIYIDDVQVAHWRGDDWTTQGSLIPVYKDGVISGSNSGEAMFYPCKGVE